MADLIKNRPITRSRLRYPNSWLAERLLNDLFGDGFSGASEEDLWPPVDVYHDSSTFFVRAEIPGVELKDVVVRVQGPHLVIEGERRPPEGFSYHQIESIYGAFSRTVHLPVAVDTEKIDAQLVDGVLTVSFPVKESLKPKSIPVKTG